LVYSSFRLFSVFPCFKITITFTSRHSLGSNVVFLTYEKKLATHRLLLGPRYLTNYGNKPSVPEALSLFTRVRAISMSVVLKSFIILDLSAHLINAVCYLFFIFTFWYFVGFIFEVWNIMFETSSGDILHSVYEGCVAPSILMRYYFCLLEWVKSMLSISSSHLFLCSLISSPMSLLTVAFHFYLFIYLFHSTIRFNKLYLYYLIVFLHRCRLLAAFTKLGQRDYIIILSLSSNIPV